MLACIVSPQSTISPLYLTSENFFHGGHSLSTLSETRLPFMRGKIFFKVTIRKYVEKGFSDKEHTVEKQREALCILKSKDMRLPLSPFPALALQC